MKKRLLAAALAATMLISIVSCGGSGDIAMSYDGTSVTERMYKYWATNYKEYILESFGGSDTDSFWNTEVAEGLTMADYADRITLANIKKNLVCMKLFDEYKLKLSETALASVDSDITDLLDAYGSRAALNADLAQYGINDKILRRIYEIQEEISAVFEYLYGEDGLYPPTNEELENYYKENYACIKYITVLLYKTSVGADGKETVSSLTNEELLAKSALVDEAMDLLDGGADFEEVFAKYNEFDMTGYEGGVYISKNDSGYDIISQALAMENGEIKLIEQNNAIYIVKRYPLAEKPYLDDKMGQFSELAGYCSDELFQTRLTELSAEVSVNTEVVARNPVRYTTLG